MSTEAATPGDGVSVVTPPRTSQPARLQTQRPVLPEPHADAELLAALAELAIGNPQSQTRRIVRSGSSHSRTARGPKSSRNSDSRSSWSA
jgi:hypothetical protein